MTNHIFYRRCELAGDHIAVYGRHGLVCRAPRVILRDPVPSPTMPGTVRGMFHSASLEDVRRFLLHAIKGHVRVTQMHPEDTPQYAVGLDLGGDKGMTWLAIWEGGKGKTWLGIWIP